MQIWYILPDLEHLSCTSVSTQNHNKRDNGLLVYGMVYFLPFLCFLMKSLCYTFFVPSTCHIRTLALLSANIAAAPSFPFALIFHLSLKSRWRLTGSSDVSLPKVTAERRTTELSINGLDSFSSILFPVWTKGSHLSHVPAWFVG